MRIIEWNCQGAFRKKNDKRLSLNPDILIIPECENEKKLKFGNLTPKPNDFLWFGDNENKGIGIFSYSDYKFELMREYNAEFKYIIPLKVAKNDNSFLLFAIWAKDNKQNHEARYIGQIWLAINYYSELFHNETILIGDFNSNKIWDYKDRVGNHSDVVEFLGNKKIRSLYHLKNDENQGKEKTPTFYMYRKLEKTYHIDYCFVSKNSINNGFDFAILDINNWIKFSDHSPIVVEIEKLPKTDEVINSLSLNLERKFKKINIKTKEKFEDIISIIIENVQKTDTFGFSESAFKEREILIEKANKILDIDKLIKEIYE